MYMIISDNLFRVPTARTQLLLSQMRALKARAGAVPFFPLPIYYSRQRHMHALAARSDEDDAEA